MAHPDPMEDSLLAELDALLGPASPVPPESPRPRTIEPVQPSVPVIAMDLRHAPKPEPVPEAPPAPKPKAPAGPAARKPRLLLVDDSKDYRDVIRYLLNSNGYEVVEAVDGEQGVHLAVSDPPDLILLDFNMPGMNGYEVIQTLRGIDETRKIPIMLFTGAPNREHLKKMALDIAAFIDKPVSSNQLLATIKKVAVAAGCPPVEGEAAAPSPAASPKAPAADEPLPVVEAAATKEEPVPTLENLESLAQWGKGDDLLVNIEKASEEEHEDHKLDAVTDDSPLIARVNQILVRAVDMGASDIHIEPQESGIVVRVRVNGSLQQICTLPAAVSTRLAARVKIMSELVITERRRPQDGQFRATIRGKKVEFRVSVLPTTIGEKIVLRVLGGSKVKAGTGDLGMTERDTRCVDRALATPHGLILVTGPTGSGKTTSLYSMLASLNKPDVNIMTAEDPVEYRLAGISQVHVKPAVGLTFEAALRSFLRQDPDVMLVGEIRDLETAEIAVKASITGHLVLSTLHTNSAPATVTRLTHMGLAPFLVAASVKLIVAQRLIKVLCDKCKVEAPISGQAELLSEQERSRFERVFRPVGCPECEQSGFSGRKPVFEVMPIGSVDMRRLILEGASVDDLYVQAVKEGMTTLREAALAAVCEGITSLSEGMKIIIAE